MSSQSLCEKFAYASAVLFAPAFAGVVGGELGSGAGEPMIWDKELHFMAYFILALLAAVALRTNRNRLLGLAGLVAMGGILEIVQGFIGRDGSFYDEFANTLGVIAGGLLGWFGQAALVRLTPAD